MARAYLKALLPNYREKKGKTKIKQARTADNLVRDSKWIQETCR
jgi:hypothetical protein